MGVREVQNSVAERHGYTPSYRAVLSWINTGVRPGGNRAEPVKLRAVRVGKKFITDENSLTEFMAKLNPST